jgi:hypothetical protein
MLADNGATVYILKEVHDSYNVVIDGARGLITTLKNIPLNSLIKLALNYGWK